MRDHGRQFVGPFTVEILATLPVYTSGDKGRFVFSEYDNKTFYGDDSKWAEWGTSGTAGK